MVPQYMMKFGELALTSTKFSIWQSRQVFILANSNCHGATSDLESVFFAQISLIAGRDNFEMSLRASASNNAKPGDFGD
jgi:hypothetical protein